MSLHTEGEPVEHALKRPWPFGDDQGSTDPRASSTPKMPGTGEGQSTCLGSVSVICPYCYGPQNYNLVPAEASYHIATPYTCVHIFATVAWAHFNSPSRMGGSALFTNYFPPCAAVVARTFVFKF